MTLDPSRNTPIGQDVAHELRALRAEVAGLTTPRPLDYHALVERGYSEKEAYALLRRHGVRLPGGRRSRISVDVLTRIEAGEIPV